MHKSNSTSQLVFLLLLLLVVVERGGGGGRGGWGGVSGVCRPILEGGLWVPHQRILKITQSRTFLEA